MVTCIKMVSRKWLPVGHLNVVKWSRENGCPWGVDTSAEAAGGGHLNVLQWCRENGCPWNKFSILNAERQCHWNVALWCRENGCPLP